MGKISMEENNVFQTLCNRFIHQLVNLKEEKDIRLELESVLVESNSLFYKTKQNLNEERISFAKELVYNSIRKGESVSLESVASQMYISPYYLSRSFKKYEGINFVEYLKNVRLEYGKHLMATTNDTIEEIAFKCGYNEANSFRRLFKISEGISPTEYRKKIHVKEE